MVLLWPEERLNWTGSKWSSVPPILFRTLKLLIESDSSAPTNLRRLVLLILFSENEGLKLVLIIENVYNNQGINRINMNNERDYFENVTVTLNKESKYRNYGDHYDYIPIYTVDTFQVFRCLLFCKQKTWILFYSGKSLSSEEETQVEDSAARLRGWTKPAPSTWNLWIRRDCRGCHAWRSVRDRAAGVADRGGGPPLGTMVWVDGSSETDSTVTRPVRSALVLQGVPLGTGSSSSRGGSDTCPLSEVFRARPRGTPRGEVRVREKHFLVLVPFVDTSAGIKIDQYGSISNQYLQFSFQYWSQ